MKARRAVSCAVDIFCLVLFVYLLVFPEYASAPTRIALEFCFTALLPSLFMYGVLSRIAVGTPFVARLSRIFGVGTAVLAIGMLCGAPIGAVTATSLYKNGAVKKKYAEYLVSFTNCASLSFLLGYVGNMLFGDISVGVRLAVYQLASSVFTAAVMKRVMFGKEKQSNRTGFSVKRVGLREAVSETAESMINICACAVFFAVAGSVLANLGIFGETVGVLVKCLLEFSTGCAAAAKSADYNFLLVAVAVGFSGFSVLLQVYSAIANKLSLMPFLVGKLISGTVMTLLAFIFG